MKAGRNPREKAAKSRGRRAASPGLPGKALRSGRLPDLTPLSEEELAAVIVLAEQELSARRDRKRAEFFVSIRQQAQALGVAPEEVAAELTRTQQQPDFDRRAKVAPKYRNPANPAETWAGRGAKPKWMQALLAQGKSMDDFKIAH